METAIVGLLSAILPTMAVFFMQRSIKARDAEREHRAEEARADRREKDKAYLQFHTNILKLVMASIALGESTAIAMQNGKTNGETDRALRYARQVKNEQKDFLHEQGIENILKQED